MDDLIDRDALLKDMGLTDATKYGNKDAEQQHRSYSTWMSYEIADAIQDAPAVNRWIPCSERLPETTEAGLDCLYSDCVLVAADDWIGMAYCLTDGKKTWWEFADAQNKARIDWTEVTHWMPLPEPPESEAQKNAR